MREWEDNLGNPQWTIYGYGGDDGEAVAVVATKVAGTAIGGWRILRAVVLPCTCLSLWWWADWSLQSSN